MFINNFLAAAPRPDLHGTYQAAAVDMVRLRDAVGETPHDAFARGQGAD
ncbi:hypothetical protein GCM10010212_28720 [Paenarthrobacter nicotinovorans]|nr:hypothetical protein GCM10010212_28720 [Paenarthrobacter nicotinovorans]